MTCTNDPWFPTIISDKCDGCAKIGKARCVEFCPNKVFSFKDGKAEVTNPADCGGGSSSHHCSACAPLCHNKAIVFASNCCQSIAESDKNLLRKTICERCGNVLDKQPKKYLFQLSKERNSW